MSSIKNIFLVGLLIGITVLLTLWWLHIDVAPVIINNNKTPDIIMQNITAVEFDQTGNKQYTLTSPSITHFSDNDATFFQNIIIVTQDNTKNIWRISANQAKATKNFSIMNLHGNIKAIQTGSGANLTKAYTNDIVLYPNKKIATTQEKVIIIQGGNSLEGIGMDSNMQTGITHFHSQVKVNFIPQTQATDNSNINYAKK